MTTEPNNSTVADDQVSEATPERSDEELLLHYRQSGDKASFDALVRRYERELFSYLRRYLNNAELAEDAFQGTFLQVHLKGDQFQEGRKFRPWLYTIATNQAIDLQRRNKRHRMLSLDSGSRGGGDEDLNSLVSIMASDDPEPEKLLEGREREEWVRNSVADLPEPFQQVVNLVYYQGMKYREAAEVLDIPVGTVKSRLHSALLKLNESWQESGVR